MNLQQLTDTVNTIFYDNTASYKVVASKQKELLAILKPNTDIKKIDYKTIQNYIKELKNRDNKPATINSKLAYLNKALNYAHRCNLIENKPYIPTLKIQTTKTKYINDNELKQMIEYTIDNNLKELYQVIIIGINTGIRISNILSILPEDIDNNYIRIYKNKTNKPYSVPMNNAVQEIFNDFTIFTMNYRQIQYQFDTMIKKLNLDTKITIHTLRHTTASKLIQKNMSLAVIQQLLNHKSIKTTLRYTHLNNTQLEEAVAVL